MKLKKIGWAAKIRIEIQKKNNTKMTGYSKKHIGWDYRIIQ
ncbi:hypothetical protein OFR29_00715 [Brachyspira hyodysenteriae]|nr:hypothetical protein [Brachyspira hyodysenteriae]MCZ9885336.1 hypothetical protein [Brachyspira hyodysenteriae]MCZ9890858.1 hypothetical protein [Brachyspira hyodysenteriae]MCZ9937819.1 hypothetical protein [Brachyspira hyodysenteriae]MCZ9996756.1 hypothetical protein [Brachyspira hyodysenteriae]MDA0005204.1 hypothetical protein [Brachyspira hyodysenteriae]